jgi:predicted kinase
MALDAGAAFLIAECCCPVKTALRRINQRLKQFSFSDATEEVYWRIRKNFDPVKKSADALRIDTSKSLSRSLSRIERTLLRR